MEGKGDTRYDLLSDVSTLTSPWVESVEHDVQPMPSSSRPLYRHWRNLNLTKSSLLVCGTVEELAYELPPAIAGAAWPAGWKQIMKERFIQGPKETTLASRYTASWGSECLKIYLDYPYCRPCTVFAELFQHMFPLESAHLLRLLLYGAPITPITYAGSTLT